MFCPECRSEYREGFTRCAECDVPLVPDLAVVETPEPPQPVARRGPMVDYCGFFTLEEARQAREALRRRAIPSEISVREVGEPGPEGRYREEYWIRFSAADFDAASAVLGYEETRAADERLTCPRCAAVVAAAEVFCPSCGIRFGERP